jgi:hypothetical protein
LTLSTNGDYFIHAMKLINIEEVSLWLEGMTALSPKKLLFTFNQRFSRGVDSLILKAFLLHHFAKKKIYNGFITLNESLVILTAKFFGARNAIRLSQTKTGLTSLSEPQQGQRLSDV